MKLKTASGRVPARLQREFRSTLRSRVDVDEAVLRVQRYLRRYFPKSADMDKLDEAEFARFLKSIQATCARYIKSVPLSMKHENGQFEGFSLLLTMPFEDLNNFAAWSINWKGFVEKEGYRADFYILEVQGVLATRIVEIPELVQAFAVRAERLEALSKEGE